MEQFKTTKELQEYAKRNRGAKEYVPKVIKEDAKAETSEATETPKKKGTKKDDEK